ncbi:MAG TPA: PQQ-binding-like beta-propeller repeat protein [Streptosporangiaceae bacterium]|nr:PQQ-binding-like beta-propeller repeat protein [Streptosporangiaceae bacterium]
MEHAVLRVPASRRRLVVLGATVALAGFGTVAAASAPHGHRPGGFNTPGNILIADQFNNRVVEVNSAHQVVWQFGDGSYLPGPDSIVGVNDAERVGGLTLLAGTGTPPGADPSCPLANGCPDNRVILVNQPGHIVWQYGQAGVTGAGPNELNTPVQSTYLPDGDVLITDQGNQRVIEVKRNGQIVWQYGQTGVAGAGSDQLSNPNSAELLANGDILIADESNNRVIEVNRSHQIVWQYGSPSDTTTLNGAAFASRLSDGDTLITDSNNNRILIVTQGKQVVFDYATNTRPGSMDMPLPTRAVMLSNGNVLISDQFNDQVIEINQQQQIVFSQGQIQTDGNGFNLLNAPYDAKVIGDYTGLTPPGS